MPTLTKERERPASTEAGRAAIEARLAQMQTDDYVMPGWQTAWSELDDCVMVMFQLCCQGMPQAMTEYEFRMWAQGWDDRQAAVMARRPRPEQVRPPILP
jgi:hypothetical protein